MKPANFHPASVLGYGQSLRENNEKTQKLFDGGLVIYLGKIWQNNATTDIHAILTTTADTVSLLTYLPMKSTTSYKK